MLISNKHKFIFIKPRRAAGSAVQELLKPHADMQLTQHTTAAECKQKHPKEWRRYEKIACIRHPYERVVSHYCRRVDEGIFSGTISDFIIEKYRPLTVYAHVNIDDRVDVDHWIFFEDLSESIGRIFTHFGLPLPEEIPVLKPSSKNGQHHRLFLSNEDIEAINYIYSEDVQLARRLGYVL